jgi:hypothetical protein
MAIRGATTLCLHPLTVPPPRAAASLAILRGGVIPITSQFSKRLSKAFRKALEPDERQALRSR